MRRAAEARKYVFLFFYQAENDQTLAARKAFEEAMAQLVTRADSAMVNRADANEQEIVKRLGLDRAPMPLILAIAPNGAITPSFVGSVGKDQLLTAFVSDAMARCLKALQDRKLVFVSVQGPGTQHNSEAMQGVREFATDKQYATQCEIVTVDPADSAEAAFLKQISVDPRTAEAVTVFLAPPGALVSTFTGATQKDALLAAAKKAAAGCDPRSGCCPTPAPASQPASPPSTNAAKTPEPKH
ncbi:MAG: hypothetical protein ACK4WH_00390 [Phycisphaerales bacterium]